MADLTAAIPDTLTAPTDAVGDMAVVSVVDQSGWIVLIEIDADSGMIRIARNGVRAPDGFYSGKVSRYGTFDSSISVPADLVRINDATCEIIDTDGSLRTLFVPKTIKRRPIRWLAGREGTPRVSFQRIFSGEISNVEFPPGLVRIQARSYVFDFYKQEVIPLLNRDNFPDLPDNPTGDFVPIILGIVSAATGAVRCHLVDTVTNSWIVARHPCESVDEVWIKEPSDTAFWLASDLNYTITGRSLNGSTSTEITYGLTLDEGTEIRANVTGMVADEAWGGVDLTNFADVLLAIVRTFGAIYDLDHFNLASFETVKTQTAADSLICAGAIVSKCTVGQVVTDLIKSSGIHLYNDNWDRIAVAYTS